MDSQELQTKIILFLKQHYLPVALAFGGLICLIYGLITLSAPKQDKPDILFESASDKAQVVKNTISPAVKQISVDVEGAVLKPGVYKLHADARIQDALIASGGLSDAADRTKVSQTINLAAKLIDGGKIYIPVAGETGSANSVAGQGSGGQSVIGAETSGSIDINSATESELDGLPGIGKVTAEKIISNRPYSSIEDLLTKKSVGKSVFEKIKDKIVAQ